MRFGNNLMQKLVYMYDHLISSQCDIMKSETVALTEWNLRLMLPHQKCFTSGIFSFAPRTADWRARFLAPNPQSCQTAG